MGPVGLAALGIGTSVAEGGGNLIFGEIAQKQQLRGQRKALEQQNAAALDIWNKTNYGAQMEHLKNAGLNPGLIYGMKGGGGATTGPANANVDSPKMNSLGIMSNIAQLNLMKSQKEALDAKANKDNADAEKTKGVDTAVGEGTVANLSANTENLKSQTNLNKLNAGMQEILNDIADASQWYKMGELEYDWKIKVQRFRQEQAKADVDSSTIETQIKTAQADLALKVIEKEATKANINLTNEQIRNLSGMLTVAFKNADSMRWAAESGAKNANTAGNAQSWDQFINDVSASTKLSVDVVKGIIQALVLKGAAGRTVVEGFKQKY